MHGTKQKNFGAYLLLVTFLIPQPILDLLFFFFLQNAFKSADFGATCKLFRPKTTIELQSFEYTHIFYEKYTLVLQL